MPQGPSFSQWLLGAEAAQKESNHGLGQSIFRLGDLLDRSQFHHRLHDREAKRDGRRRRNTQRAFWPDWLDHRSLLHREYAALPALRRKREAGRSGLPLLPRGVAGDTSTETEAAPIAARNGRAVFYYRLAFYRSVLVRKLVARATRRRRIGSD
jgi:hypothetical protein